MNQCGGAAAKNPRPRFLGMTVDEDHGGLGMGYQAHCIVMEELSRASGFHSPPPPLLSRIKRHA